ncbi:hypothetical protein BJX65DRAFT_281098 [Aspergillus insuetus]
MLGTVLVLFVCICGLVCFGVGWRVLWLIQNGVARIHWIAVVGAADGKEKHAWLSYIPSI